MAGNNYLPTEYQTFIHASRYARWLPDESRRETWIETVTRFSTFSQIHLKKNLGVTLESYLANQVYYPFENGKTYYGYKSFHPNNQRNTPLYLNGPTPNDYSGIENEYTNEIVKNPFQKITKKAMTTYMHKTICIKPYIVFCIDSFMHILLGIQIYLFLSWEFLLHHLIPK